MTLLGSDGQGLAACVDPDLHEVLEGAAPARASDVHIAAGSPPLYRIDGRLRSVSSESWGSAKVEQALYSLLSPLQAAQFDAEHELDLAFTLQSGRRIRVNLFRERGAVAAAVRVVSTTIPSLDELSLPPQVARFADMPRGLVLVTGPTGMGKSTTLAAIVDRINRTHAKHIMTIEDPIEFVHTSARSLVQQREVGTDTKSFAEALRRLLRQDPDVIMVSDLRDLESIQFALEAADTGHLVLATLHTQSAAQTINRIVDVFSGSQQAQVRAQLSTALKGVISQTLVPVASGVGRIPAVEIMFTSPAIANLIREGRTHQIPSAMVTSGEDGMITLDQSLAHLVNQGTLEFEAAIARAYDVETFRQLTHRWA